MRTEDLSYCTEERSMSKCFGRANASRTALNGLPVFLGTNRK